MDNKELENIHIMLEEAGTRCTPYDAICVINTYLDFLKKDHPTLNFAASHFSLLAKNHEPIPLRKTAAS